MGKQQWNPLLRTGMGEYAKYASTCTSIATAPAQRVSVIEQSVGQSSQMQTETAKHKHRLFIHPGKIDMRPRRDGAEAYQLFDSKS
ncbi:hypothetical protein CABS01_05077 [Colletotrichum abscissum]|uniref:Uncharacterized protein n=2 Tax=Colletotrichum acutatum species complex TaxID=2707335 RepID=A0AAJ0E1F3_9PEZI|nr:uncharacterized protein CCOS01_07604 [Colletotrichum costaricense]XP_060405619.1 uncharacterized protein CABS01_05077 [Colletotrichum abscissum]KAI3541062.1 hypothetical protein CSPX01_07720 [Colletotrichum filicis]KAK1457251.1 hypothetical protein CCUS01_01718 [Colletotrichum cuscutae]KAK1523456.1 hypothetical protein CABS01_05077 [Colletotrichum abscissum]KAK1527342.1 hypothetical protein CCOS01_07604 [Colletotrichum costaricense]